MPKLSTRDGGRVFVMDELLGGSFRHNPSRYVTVRHVTSQEMTHPPCRPTVSRLSTPFHNHHVHEWQQRPLVP